MPGIDGLDYTIADGQSLVDLSVMRIKVVLEATNVDYADVSVRDAAHEIETGGSASETGYQSIPNHYLYSVLCGRTGVPMPGT